MATLLFLAGLWWFGLLALLAGSALLAALQPWLAGRRALGPVGEPVSVLVPLRDPGEMETLANRALSALDYPSVELVFSVREPPPGDIVSPAWRESKDGVPCRLVTTTARLDCNPKLANLIEPIEVAAHDLLLLKDAGTSLPPAALAAMVASLKPVVGLVCCVPIARGPVGAAAQIEACLINGHGARLLLAMSSLGGGAGIGAAMLLRRTALREAGGIEAILTAIADDHALSRLLARRRLRTVFAPACADQQLGRRGAGAVWYRHLRWAICRRTAAPLAFAAEPFTGLVAAVLLAPAAALWLGSPAAPLVLITVLAWPLVEIGLSAIKGWPLFWAMPLAVLLREVLMPALWISALMARDISWGDRRMAVRAWRA